MAATKIRAGPCLCWRRSPPPTRTWQGATGYFERAIKVAQEPKVIAWSHIYLGRIFDLQEQRDSAVDHYHAALTAGGTLPEVKAAAERGLQAAVRAARAPAAARLGSGTSIL